MMIDSALSIASKVLQPPYARGESGNARGLSDQQQNPAVTEAEGAASNAPAPADQAATAFGPNPPPTDLTRTQVVGATQPGEQARNEDDKQPESAFATAKEELEDAVSSINDFLQSSKRTLAFSVDDSSGRTIIEVKDSETDEVIRQIPPESVLSMIEKLQDGDAITATGLAENA